MDIKEKQRIADDLISTAIQISKEYGSSLHIEIDVNGQLENGKVKITETLCKNELTKGCKFP